MPAALKAQLLCKSKFEAPEVLAARRQIVSSKSVGELSQINSLSEFPVPGTLQRLLSKSKTDVTSGASSKRYLKRLYLL